MRLIFITLSIIVSILAVSCSREGEGGDTQVNAYVHRDTVGNLCVGCNVYIFYGKESIENLNTNLADDRKTTDTFGKSTFDPLRRGHYVFLAYGQDPVYLDTISGAEYFFIDNKVDVRDINIAAQPIE